MYNITTISYALYIYHLKIMAIINMKYLGRLARASNTKRRKSPSMHEIDTDLH